LPDFAFDYTAVYLTW